MLPAISEAFYCCLREARETGQGEHRAASDMGDTEETQNKRLSLAKPSITYEEVNDTTSLLAQPSTTTPTATGPTVVVDDADDPMQTPTVSNSFPPSIKYIMGNEACERCAIPSISPLRVFALLFFLCCFYDYCFSCVNFLSVFSLYLSIDSRSTVRC